MHTPNVVKLLLILSYSPLFAFEGKGTYNCHQRAMFAKFARDLITTLCCSKSGVISLALLSLKRDNFSKKCQCDVCFPDIGTRIMSETRAGSPNTFTSNIGSIA